MDRIPDEIMCKIFLFVTQPSLSFTKPGYYNEPSPLAKLSKLMMVSKGWQLVINQTPYLWTHLSSSDPLLITTKAISLSRTAPLHIKCVARMMYPDRLTSLFVDAVGSHVHRWRTAVFKNVFKALPSNESQQQQAPLLESLVVIKDFACSARNPFGGGQLPRLKYLYCQQVDWPWSVSGLSSLTIDNRRRQNITELDLAHILTNNPLLTALRIVQRYPPPEKPYPGTFPILHRPHLKSLKLDLSGSLSDFVLRHVRAPECSKFGYSIHDGWEASLQYLICFFRSTLSSASARPNLRPRLSIIPEHRSFALEMKCDGEDSIEHPTFYVHLRQIDSARLLTWTVDHLLPSTNVDLAVTLCLPNGFPLKTRSQLQEFLRKLPPATDLDISNGYKPDFLFDLLSVDLKGSESDAGDSFLLPGLEEITLFALDCDWDGFLRMLEERSRTVGRISSPAPLKLRLIQLELDEDVKQRIVDLVGQENVTEEEGSDTEDDPGSDAFLEY